MTLFPRELETHYGIDTSEWVSGVEALEVGDIVSEWVTNIVINGAAAPSLHELSEGHQTPHIWDFEGAEAFYFAEDSIGNGANTMYMW